MSLAVALTYPFLVEHEYKIALAYGELQKVWIGFLLNTDYVCQLSDSSTVSYTDWYQSYLGANNIASWPGTPTPLSIATMACADLQPTGFPCNGGGNCWKNSYDFSQLLPYVCKQTTPCAQLGGAGVWQSSCSSIECASGDCFDGITLCVECPATNTAPSSSAPMTSSAMETCDPNFCNSYCQQHGCRSGSCDLYYSDVADNPCACDTCLDSSQYCTQEACNATCGAAGFECDHGDCDQEICDCFICDCE